MRASCASPTAAPRIGSIDEKAIRRAAKGPIEFVRNGNFLAIVGDDETAVEAAGAAAVNHVTWQNVEAPTPTQQEANWLLQRPVVDRVFGAPDAGQSARPRALRSDLFARLSRACLDLAVLRARALQGRPADGVDALPGRLSAARGAGEDAQLEPSSIIVHHVQGSGCYGHNGADDAAADAAIIAMQMPGQPIRVRWRREEEFIYEPKTPAMVVKVRALLDDAGKPADWTQEIWSPTHNQRPGAGGNLLGALALPNPPPEPPPNDVPEANGGGATRNAEPLYDIPGQAHHSSPGDRNAGAHLGAARARRHAERVRDRMLHRRAGRARRHRIRSRTGCRSPPTHARAP